MLKKFRLENNLSPNVGAWKDILDAYNDEVTDEDVWHIAKESKEVPEIANIYQYLLIEKILNHLRDEIKSLSRVSLYMHINFSHTHFYVEGYSIDSVEKYFEIIDKVKANY